MALASAELLAPEQVSVHFAHGKHDRPCEGHSDGTK